MAPNMVMCLCSLLFLINSEDRASATLATCLYNICSTLLQ